MKLCVANRTAFKILIFLVFFSTSAWSEQPPVYDYNWTSNGHEHSMRLIAHDAKRCRAAYETLPHAVQGLIHVRPPKLSNFILREPCQASIGSIAEWLLNDARRHGYDFQQTISHALNFVRYIPNALDRKMKGHRDYWSYPYETILDNFGDCEDHAFLFAAILSHWCVDAVIVDFSVPKDAYGHIAVAVKSELFGVTEQHLYLFNVAGSPYYFCEPTGNKTTAHMGECLPNSKYSKAEYKAERFFRVPKVCSYPLADGVADINMQGERLNGDEDFQLAQSEVPLQCRFHPDEKFNEQIDGRMAYVYRFHCIR
jgi:predicted transglutaminase-like cysteine proteinase